MQCVQIDSKILNKNNMKRSHIFFASLVITLFVISCSKSNEADLYQNNNNNNNNGNNNNNTCDTVNMKFATNVKPILQSNCYACHSNANYAISGVKLEDYADVVDHALDGMLMGVITHAAGYPPMPQGGAKLSDCSINKIKSWVDHGALNN